MATVDSVQLSASQHPGYIHAKNVSQDTANRVGRLLKENHERFHVFFDHRGLHNHILHQVLAMYSLGATPGDIQQAWDRNMGYQLPKGMSARKLDADLGDTNVFLESMTKPSYYAHFLQFFENEISAKGIPAVVNEYVFKGDERANKMLTRMYDGVIHGLIHLGYALEFQQPLILAEALAEAAITDENLDGIIDDVVLLKKSAVCIPDSSLMSIYTRMRNDPAIFNAVKSSDGPNKIRDGIILRAKKNMIPYLAEFSVKPHQLKQKAAELANTSLFIAAAAQRPCKVVMFDFFLMHSVNSAIWMSVFTEQPWISDQVKCRLLEIKGWSDLITYGACKTPALYPDRIYHYAPKIPGDWASVFKRAVTYNDDGHVPKFIRAIKYVEHVSHEYAGQAEFPLRPELCLTVAHMVMDSVERQNAPHYRLPGNARFYESADIEVQRFVRYCGLDEAWSDVADSEKLAVL